MIDLDVAVTGIGSLPLGDPDRAVAFVAAHAPEVPFWPQLPVRSASEGMVVQALGVGPDLVTAAADGRVVAADADVLLDHLMSADPAVRPDEAAGFAAFVRAWQRGAFPSARAVKGQIAGPLTVGWALSVDGHPAWEDPLLFTAIVHRIASRAAWQARVLGLADLPVVVVVDEPVLGLVDVDGADPLAPVWAAIRAEDALPGLHSCATRGGLPDGLPDLIALDLVGRDGVLPGSVAAAWRDGGMLAAGLVPTVADTAALPSPAAVASGWLAAAGACGDPAELVSRTLLTATCGLAGVDVSAAAASFSVTRDAGDLIRRRLGRAPRRA